MRIMIWEDINSVSVNAYTLHTLTSHIHRVDNVEDKQEGQFGQQQHRAAAKHDVAICERLDISHRN